MKGKSYKSPNSSFKEYKSVDWYLKQGILKGRIKRKNLTKLNAETIYNFFLEVLSGQKHSYVIILKSDIYLENTDFVIGASGKTMWPIISIYRFRNLETPDLKYEVIKTATMHEIGHVLGIPNENKRNNFIKSLDNHCPNVCVMRQGLRVPDDWIKMTNDRIKSGEPLCNECINDLFVLKKSNF